MSTVRLTCMNCNAQYEVPLDVIPAEGRDVQCSNCDHVWFQTYPDSAGPSDPQTPDTPLPVLAEEEEDDGFVDEFELPIAFTPPSERTLDPAVADVLRQEAELEISKRRSEQKTPTPPAPQEQAAPEDRTAVTSPPPAFPVSRRDLLPDVDAVKDTIPPLDTVPEPQAESEREPVATDRDATAQKKGFDRSGFMTGFACVAILVALALGLYVAAPHLVDQFPQAAPGLSVYTGWIDSARIALDETARALMVRIDTLL